MNKKQVMITVERIKSVTAQHVLREAGIEVYELDKMDSAHAGIFGNIELYVPADQEQKAREILQREEILY